MGDKDALLFIDFGAQGRNKRCLGWWRFPWAKSPKQRRSRPDFQIATDPELLNCGHAADKTDWRANCETQQAGLLISLCAEPTVDIAYNGNPWSRKLDLAATFQMQPASV